MTVEALLTEAQVSEILGRGGIGNAGRAVEHPEGDEVDAYERLLLDLCRDSLPAEEAVVH